MFGNDFVDDWKGLIVPARHPLAQFHTKFWGLENTEGKDVDPCGCEVQRDVTVDKTQRRLGGVPRWCWQFVAIVHPRAPIGQRNMGWPRHFDRGGDQQTTMLLRTEPGFCVRW